MDILFKEVEQYYQDIIRKVDDYVNMQRKAEYVPYIERIIQDIDNSLSKNKRVNYIDYEKKAEKKAIGIIKSKNVQEVKTLDVKNVVLGELVKDERENNKIMSYEHKLLESLATQGLLIESLAHDIKLHVSDLPQSAKNLEKSLKKYDVWEIVNLEENKKIASRDVPGIIDKLYIDGKYVQKTMLSIIDNMRKSKFDIKNIKINEYFNQLEEYWRDIDASLSIEYKSDIEELVIDETTLNVVFFNLLNNTRKHNRHNAVLIANIYVGHNENGETIITYADNGNGLDKRYQGRENNIFNPHETSLTDSHGLGMWIIRERLNKINGTVSIDNDYDGFKIDILIKGEKKKDE